MRDEDLKNAFGKADPSFERRVLHTLTTIKMQREEKPVRKIKFGLILAIVLIIILGGVALAAANQWGLFEFLEKHDMTLLPEAVETIEHPEQNGGDGVYATFTVREALYDEVVAHLVVKAIPKEGVLLVLPDSSLNDRMSELGKAFKGNSERIGKYAEQNGLDKIVRVTMGNDDYDAFSVETIDAEALDNGGMAYRVSGSVPNGIDLLISGDGQRESAGSLQITLRCIQTDINDPQYPEDRATVVAFDLTAMPSNWGPISSDEAVTFEDAGLIVERVVMIGTPMATYGKIEYRTTRDVDWKEHLIPVDEQGKARIYEGFDDRGEESDTGTLYQQYITMPAQEQPPSHIDLVPTSMYDVREPSKAIAFPLK